MLRKKPVLGAGLVAVAIVIVALLTRGQAITTGRTVGPGGEQIVFLHFPPEGSYGDLYVIDAGSGMLTQLTQGAVVRGAVLSPDGQRVALVTGTSGIDLYALNIGAGELVQMNTAQGSAGSPAWSLDGQRIVYTAGAAIVISGADGGGTRELTSGAYPAWSSDGQQIVYQAREPVDASHIRFELHVIPVEGGETQRLITREGEESLPRWSPDGARLFFMDDILDQWGGVVGQYLVIANADGSEVRRVAEIAPFHLPAWSPDGLRILFEDVSGAICQVAVDGEEPDCGAAGEYPVWSPDTTRILYVDDNMTLLCIRSESAPRRCFDNISLGGRLFPLGWRPGASGT